MVEKHIEFVYFLSDISAGEPLNKGITTINSKLIVFETNKVDLNVKQYSFLRNNTLIKV